MNMIFVNYVFSIPLYKHYYEAYEPLWLCNYERNIGLRGK